MATVRLDLPTETILKQLSSQRGQTKSDVIRDAIALLAEDGGRGSALQALQPFVGIGDSGGQQLSERTGEAFRELLESRRARRSR